MRTCRQLTMLSMCACRSGITNNGYLFLIGMLMSQYTITGYDACRCAPHACLRTQLLLCLQTWGLVLDPALSLPGEQPQGCLQSSRSTETLSGPGKQAPCAEQCRVHCKVCSVSARRQQQQSALHRPAVQRRVIQPAAQSWCAAAT